MSVVGQAEAVSSVHGTDASSALPFTTCFSCRHYRGLRCCLSLHREDSQRGVQQLTWGSCRVSPAYSVNPAGTDTTGGTASTGLAATMISCWAVAWLPALSATDQTTFTCTAGDIRCGAKES
jgi:hypothetical protein